MQEKQLGVLSLAHGTVEIRRYAWDEREFLTFSRDDYMLSRVVSRKNRSQRIDWRLPCAAQGVPAMQMSVVAPECPVDVAFDKGEALVISCILDPDYFRSATGIGEWCEQHTLACLSLSSPLIGLIFDRLAHEVFVPRHRSDDVAETFIGALAGEVSRGLLRSLGERPYGELAPWQLQHIYDLAANECERRLTAKQIAYACDISTRHLVRAFKVTTGLTLHQFLSETRMQRAMTLLRGRDDPIKHVAARLGFSTPSAFSAAFLHTVGSTPSDYRARFTAN